ncbi:MAG: DUF1570 domain-containing protein [Planctomycetaceae bacterium]|jgi:hypothetical protein
MSELNTRRRFLGSLGQWGLRCGVIGWATDVEGQVADSPLERPLENFQIEDSRMKIRDFPGTVLTTAKDGGLLVMGQDGRLWTVEPQNLKSRQSLGCEFEAWDRKSLIRRLEDELIPGCEFVQTKHYVVASYAGRAYAQWCAGLFERLHQAFRNYWKQRDILLRDPEFPLVAILLKDERQFRRFATDDAGADAAGSQGYFSIESNRIVIYDLTSSERATINTAAEIVRSVSANPFNIATVVHEATHQIAFNSGMHVRLSDNPLWLTEGMAMFFETPDLANRTGWRTIGLVNELRLRQFLNYCEKRRRADSLETLLSSDRRFTEVDSAVDAYSESWALTYYLLRTQQAAYGRLLRKLQNQPVLKWQTEEERLEDFCKNISDDLTKLDADFLKYIRRIKT